MNRGERNSEDSRLDEYWPQCVIPHQTFAFVTDRVKSYHRTFIEETNLSLVKKAALGEQGLKGIDQIGSRIASSDSRCDFY